VGKRSSRQQIVYLPLVLCATFLVTVSPVMLVWWLRDSGAVTSVWVGIGIGVAASFGASYVGSALWKRRTGSQDVLFGELMLWGWVQRWRAERRLATATDVLGLRHGPRRSVSGGRLTHEQRAGLLTQLASGLEARDPYTHGHSRRVARHASTIAKRMGLSSAEVAKIRTAGVIHDVGKVNISTAVLHKQGKLTDGEFKVVKRHPVEGATMVSTLGDDELTAIVRHHHERLDGTGYPDRLAGDAIPLGARIIAVADTFDAITSTRPYRQAHAHKKAIDILTAEAGTQLDPDAVRAFRSCYAGSRPLALWTILTNGPPKLASWLGGGLSTAKAASVANVMATAATTAAVGGAALGPLVEAPTRSHRAAEGATAPGLAPAARQRPLTSAGRNDATGRPLDARGRSKDLAESKGHRLVGRISPGARHRDRKRHGGNGTIPPSGTGVPGKAQSRPENTVPPGAPGQAKDHGQGGPGPPRSAPGNGKGSDRGGTGAHRGAPGHSKGKGGRAQSPAKRPAPEGPAIPGDAKSSPIGGKDPTRDPGGPTRGKHGESGKPG